MTGQSMRKALTEDRIRAMREDPGPDVSEHALDHTVSLEETPDGVRAFMLFDPNPAGAGPRETPPQGDRPGGKLTPQNQQKGPGCL